MLDKLKNICSLNAPSGFEENMRKYIIDTVEPIADNIYVDSLGNVVAFKKGSGQEKKTLAVCVSMDEIGLIVSGITDEGYLKFNTLGNISASVISCKPVEIGEKKVQGIIGTKPIHLLTAEEREKSIDINNLYIDIGATDKQQAEKLVNYGDYVSFSSEFTYSDKKILGKALNTRLPCFLLLDIMQQQNKNDVYFIFVAQSKLSNGSAEIVAYSVDADIVLVLDSIEASEQKSKDNCKLGDGVIIPVNTGNLFYNKGIIKSLSKLADSEGIKYKLKSVKHKSGNAEAFATVKGGKKTACVLFPCRYTQSIHMVADKGDYEEMKKLTLSVINS